MTRTLFLLRHAKSSWADESLDDFDRPLAKRGRETAPLVGQQLAARGWLPDLALVSGALRARETWALVAPEFPAAPKASFSDALYHGTPESLLDTLQKVPKSRKSVMLVGHNPGLEEFAQLLAGPQSDRLALATLKEKFPTAAVARLVIDGAWADLAAGRAALTDLLRPKDLS